MLFGTFQNPKEFDYTCGFGDDKELELKKMLFGVDVNKPGV
jgi:hypothetical protein